MKIHPSNLIIGALAFAGLITMVSIVAMGDKAYPVADPVVSPPAKPFSSVVAGAGLVEAASENISVGVPVPGVVENVFVKVGQRVEAGDALFSIDQRQIDAEISSQEAAVEVARTRINESLALEREARELFAKVRDLTDERAVSREEIVRREMAEQAATARVQMARAALVQAEAMLAATRVNKDRLTVRAPVTGEILQLNVRVGEYASPEGSASLLVMGDTRTLHVRVDIDENDAWRIQPGARAVAYVRGNNQLSTPAEFVRFEPLVVPKRNLTGHSTERIDTRVLQVLYSFPREKLSVYVGQQMDVMIEAQQAGGGRG